MNFAMYSAVFQADDQTKGIVMVGEIGGGEEEDAADYIKPCYQASSRLYCRTNRSCWKTHGTCRRNVTGGKGTAEGKVAALKAAELKW